MTIIIRTSMTLLCLMAYQNVFAANVTYLDSTIRYYFSDTRHHLINNAYKDRARQFIFNELKKSGLETHFHNCTFPGGLECLNIIGVIKGDRFGTADDKIIGLGAHYDTVNNTKGVDDNGAGVAALLEVAKQMFNPHTTRKNTVIFVSFDLEEEGYRGSSLFIYDWLSSWIQANYGEAGLKIAPHGIIILDTMMEFNRSAKSQQIPGKLELMQYLFPTTAKNIVSDNFRGDFIATIYRKVPDRFLAYYFVESWMALSKSDNNFYQIEQFNLPLNDVTALSQDVFDLYGNFLRSDHYNFWVNNIPAIFLTDSADFRGDMVNCYHNQCDNIDVMLTEDNIKFLGRTADVIYQTMHQLSEPTTESATSCGNTNQHISFALLTFLIILKIMMQ